MVGTTANEGRSRETDPRDPDVAEAIRDIRHRCREHAGCGGQCHEVADILQRRYGWTWEYGVYLSDALEPLGGDHSWNRLPDGSILDATADQFQEGHDVRIVPAGDADIVRFRPEWSEDYNPGRASEYPELAGVAWTGEYDADRARRLVSERGRGWWLPDPSTYRDWSPEDGYGPATGASPSP